MTDSKDLVIDAARATLKELIHEQGNATVIYFPAAANILRDALERYDNNHVLADGEGE